MEMKSILKKSEQTKQALSNSLVSEQFKFIIKSLQEINDLNQQRGHL